MADDSLPIITSECAYVEPVNSIFSVSAAIPLGWCISGKLGTSKSFSETYSCLNSDEVVHNVYNGSNCPSTPSSLLSNHTLNASVAAFNCDSYIQCNYVSFEAAAACDSYLSAGDVNVTYYGAFVTDVCVPYINMLQFNDSSTVTRCHGNAVEFVPYSDSDCSLLNDAQNSVNMTNGCSSVPPSRRLSTDDLEGFFAPPWFSKDECYVQPTSPTSEPTGI